MSTGCLFQGEDDEGGDSSDSMNGDGDAAGTSTGGGMMTGTESGGAPTATGGVPAGTGGAITPGTGAVTGTGGDPIATGGAATGGVGTGGSATGGTSSGGTDAGTGGIDAGTGGGDGDGTCRTYVNGNIPACCTPTGTNRTNVDEVLDLLNAYRNSLGLGSLASDVHLEEAMHAHCIHMYEADFFSHTSPVSSLSSPWDRAELCGTSADGENIAAGQRSPASVMESWKNSSGHDSNMRGNHTLVGIGEYEYYWGQVFK